MEKNTALKFLLKTLLGKYKNKTISIGAYFWSKLKKWYSLWEAKLETVDTAQEPSKIKARVEGKQAFLLKLSTSWNSSSIKVGLSPSKKTALFASVRAL